MRVNGLARWLQEDDAEGRWLQEDDAEGRWFQGSAAVQRYVCQKLILKKPLTDTCSARQAVRGVNCD